MSEQVLPNYVKKILHQIICEHGFKSYSMEVSPGQNPGDGFPSDLLSVEVSDNLHEEKLRILCKTAPSDEVLQERFLSSVAFNRESHSYIKVLPIFVKFQEEKNLPKIDQFSSYPKCYATLIDDEKKQYTMILEDLRQSGFKMWNKVKPSPIENLRLAMRELGKFHGISIAMKDQKPNEFAEFKQITDLYRQFYQSKFMQAVRTVCFDRAIDSLRNENHKEIIRDVKNNFMAYFEYCIRNETTDRFGVLAHGDYWSNNIMYRFNKDDIAEDIRILDWPSIRYVSPAIDILFNIFTSTKKSFRDEEYENLIKLYYESLANMVKSLGSEPDELFTFDDLKNELKICGNYALLMAPIMIHVSLRLETDVDKAQSEYDQRINDLVEDIVELGYYQQISAEQI